MGSTERSTIIQRLQEVCFEHPKVYAAWLEGADALDRVDAYSDIDLWLDVEDGHEEEVVSVVRAALGSLGEIALEHHNDHPHPKIKQVFFRLEEASKYLILDLCIQSHSRNEPFAKDEPFEVLFDKVDVLLTQPFDEVKFKQEVELRAEQLQREFELRQVWVEKAVARGHFLEALHRYHVYVLEPLIELLRLRYVPSKGDYHLKDIAHDLPDDMVKTLEDLYRVTSLEDIEVKKLGAVNLFAQTLRKLGAQFLG